MSAARRSSEPSPPPEAYRAVHDSAPLFTERLLRRHLWSKQREALDLISKNELVAIASCHGIGKSFLAACAALWFLFTRRPAIVVTTAPTWKQVHRVLWKYIPREYARLPQELQGLGKCLKGEIMLGVDHNAFGWNAADADPDAFQGIHAPHIMLIVDEAAGVDDDIYVAADSLSSGGEYRELLIGNPTSAEGKFYRAFHNEALGYKKMRVDVADTPNFTGEECPQALLSELVSREWVEKVRADWGEDSPAFLSRVHARFPSAGEQAVIAPLSWFEKAQARIWRPLPSDTAQIGVDVARFGSDRSCIVEAVGASLQAITSYQGVDTTQLTGHVRQKAQALRAKSGKRVKVCIDETGVGGGVVDQCKRFTDAGVEYIGVNFGAAAKDNGRFANLRAEMYWGVRELLQAGNNEPDLSITATGAETERLGSQLASVRYVYNARDKIQVESKEDMRKRQMHSPDEADATVLALGYRRGKAPETGRPRIAIGTMQAQSVLER